MADVGLVTPGESAGALLNGANEGFSAYFERAIAGGSPIYGKPPFCTFTRITRRDGSTSSDSWESSPAT
jgi:hypothetical protein